MSWIDAEVETIWRTARAAGYAAGHAAGRVYEQNRPATEILQLRDDWAHRPPQQPMSHADRVAAQVARYTACAAQINARLGRSTGYRYDGGPVAW